MFVYGVAVLDGMQSFQEKAFLPIVQFPFWNFNVVWVNVVIRCISMVPLKLRCHYSILYSACVLHLVNPRIRSSLQYENALALTGSPIPFSKIHLSKNIRPFKHHK